MDDRELEARLGARLHARHDRGGASPAFRARAMAAVGAEARRRELPWVLRPLALAAAAAVVVVAAGVGLGMSGRLDGLLGAAATAPGPQASPFAGTALVYEVVAPAGATPDAATMAKERLIVENRLNATGLAQFSVEVRGAQLVVALPGVFVVDEIKALVGQTGNLEFVPLPISEYGTNTNPGPKTAVEGQPLPTTEKALFTGTEIAQAYPTTDTTGLNAVEIKFKADGARLFGDYTSKHTGEFFAMVFDGTVISAPYIESAITGGTGIISGGTTGFTAAAMNNLVTILNYGALPLPLQLASEEQKGSPSPTPPPLSISNGTRIPVSLVVNGAVVETVAPGGYENPVKAGLPALPWSVETRSPSGRVLSRMTVNVGDVVNGDSGSQGDAVRVDLSCGRLDVWSGPPLAGPAPGPGQPGDCD
jgi:protein-export membrane protein SecD